jgi:hypothetical protein
MMWLDTTITYEREKVTTELCKGLPSKAREENEKTCKFVTV